MFKRIGILITILLLADLVSAINYADTSLVGVWHFDNQTAYGENNSWVYDSSTLHRGNGTFNFSYITDAGYYGKAFYTPEDGVGAGGIKLTNASTYKSPQFTFTAWIKREVANVDWTFSTFNNTGNDNGIRIFVSATDVVTFQGYNSSGEMCAESLSSAGAAPPQEWTHIAVSVNNTMGRIYVNGVYDVASTSGNISQIVYGPTNAYIGTAGYSPLVTFNGTIDEVMYWNRSLTDAEIYDVYSTGSSLGTCRTYWDYCLNINLPTIFYNDAGGANDGLYILDMREITESNLEGIAYMNSSMTNIYAQAHNTTEYGWSGPYRAAIGTQRRLWLQTNTTNNLTAAATLEVCLNGTYKNDLAAAAVPPGTGGPHAGLRYVALNDFQEYYRRNWTFLNEETGLPFDLAAGNAQMSVSCNNYSSFNITLTGIPYGSSITVQTLEEPRYAVIAYGLTPRIRQDYQHFLRDYYVLSSSAATTRYTLTLMDYTGLQCSQSTLTISKAIPGGVHVINAEPFDIDNTQYPGLQNNTQYHLTLHCDKLDYDLGMVNFVDNHLERSLVVNVPYINQYLGNTVGLLPGWTWSYASGAVGATLTSAVSTAANFTVYDISLNPYNKSYSSNASGTGLVFTYTLPNKSRDYILELRINDTRYGDLTYQKPIRLVNSTIPLNTSAVNQPLPTEIVNIASTFLKSLISAFLIILFFFVGCKASSYGLGMIVGSMVFSFMWYVNWVPQSDIPWWFCVIMVLVSSLVKMHERRIT